MIPRIAAALLLLAVPLGAAEMTGEEIVRRVTEIINPETSHARVEMVIQTSSGNTRTFVYESWSANRGEKNLIRYLEPRRAKGQATLMLNHSDDIWMFFPRTRRVRKLASHAKKQKMEGSDFSYEDMGSGDTFVNDFDSRRLEDAEHEGQACFVVELRRRPDADVSYSRLIMLVRRTDFSPLRIDYFDDKDPDRREKVLELSDIRDISGIPTAMTMVMRNLNDDTSTEMTFLEVEYNIEMEDALFTERALKK